MYMANENENKFVGEWWIPGKARQKVKGTLYISPESRARLNLIGTLGKPDSKSLFSFGKSHPKIILGSSNGKRFSLFENYISEDATGAMTPHMTLEPRLVLEGTHIKSLSDEVFSDLTVDYSHLEEWCAEEIFSGTASYAADWKPLRYDFYAVPFKSDPIKLTSINSELVISHQIQVNDQRFKKIEFTDLVTLNLSSETPKNYEWFEDLIERFQLMFALFTGKAVYPESFYLKYIDSKTKKGKRSKGTIVKAYYHFPDKENDNELDHRDVIIPLRSIKSNIFEILNNYIDKYENLKDVIELFLGTIYQPPFLAQSRFLNLMQALETFHRRTQPGRYLSESLHSKLIGKVETAYEDIFGDLSAEITTLPGKAAFPDDDAKTLGELKKVFVGRLISSNEKSLRSRMTTIFKDLSKQEAALITDKSKSFIHHTTSTRDYLTHHDKSKKKEALKGLELFKATESLKILIWILFMKELGINEITRIGLVKQNQKLNFRNYSGISYE